MELLAVALVLAPCALVALLWVRSRSDGEEPSPRINRIAVTASLLASVSVLLMALAGLPYTLDSRHLPASGWQFIVALGLVCGFIMYLLLRAILVGISLELYRWSCRLPRENATPIGHLFLVEVFILGGFMFLFVSVFSATMFAPSGIVPAWALTPLIVSILPMYNTFLIPWLRYLRAPRLSERDLAQTVAWLGKLRRQRRLPPFRVRVQEGRLANAFVTAGLRTHLVVIGGGLIDRMSHSQLVAVLAHEIAHVEKRHVPRLILPLMIVGATLHVWCVISFVNPLFDREGLFVLAGAALAGAFGGVFLAVLPGFFMRKMEFQADRLAVEMLGDGEQLVDALTRLAELNKQPLDAKGWSHPSMQARIDAIRKLPTVEASASP